MNRNISYQQLFQKAPLSTLILDTQFKILAVTDQYLAESFTTRERILGRNLFDVFPDDPSNPNATGVSNLKASLERVIKNRVTDRMATQRYDVPLPNGKGYKEKYWQPINIPVMNAQGEIDYIIHRAEDVTDKIQNTSELQETLHSVDVLEQERAMRETFVATLSHDLKQPLMAIHTGVQMLERFSDPVKRSALTAKIVANVRRTEKMISNLLDANRIHVGEPITLTIEECQLVNLVNETLDDLATIHGNRFSFVSHEPIKGFWSSEAMRRMLENLCSNAIKYGDGISQVEVRLKLDAEKLIMSVHNFGNPLDKDQIENIFHQFYRGSDNEKKKIKGWGLGLTLVKGLAEAHGGYVSVESSPLKGTTFNVIVPLDARNHLKYQTHSVLNKEESIQKQ